jgi:hypothetical protein
MRAGSRTFTSQDHTASPAAQPAGGRALAIDVPWKTLKTTVFTTWLFIAFRLFTVTIGRVPAISERVKALLVHILIRRKQRPSITHRRTVTVTDAGVEIVDQLSGLPPGAAVQAHEQFTSIHMGSSLYPDIRVASAGGEPPAWTVPVSGRLALRASLHATGAAWTVTSA